MTMPKLSSGELASLWTAYITDSMAVQVLKYFLGTCEDENTRAILKQALNLSQNHIQSITTIFNNENMPIPIGFTEKDVNLSAPRLFSDNFYLVYLYYLGNFGMDGYSLSLSISARSDIITYFEKCLTESMELSRTAKEEMLSKGTFIRPPYIPLPSQVEFVQKNNFLTGWFGNRRPLNALEISHIFLNLQRNALGSSLLIGFSQVSKSNEVSSYFHRGKEIAQKHIEIFKSILSENEIPTTLGWDVYVTDSTVSPFSYKLMMYHVSQLNAIGIGNYGIAMGASMRHDLGAHYARLTAEIGQYVNDGANIMINNEWLEQPPQSIDRDRLANQ